jgi:nucleoside 2-deoxyribosyltransferase
MARIRFVAIIAVVLVGPALFLGCQRSDGTNDPSAHREKAGSDAYKKSNRTNLELALLSILFGLIVKNTLDAAFKDEVTNFARNSNTTTLTQAALFIRPELWEFIVFLVTLLRFVYGAYRFHEAIPTHPPLGPFVIDTTGLIGLFIIVYAAGMCIRNAPAFYRFFLFFHVWDLVWFGLLQLVFPLQGMLRDVATSFLIFDAITIIGLVPILYWAPAHKGALQVLGGLLLLLVGAADIFYNYWFYVGESARVEEKGADEGTQKHNAGKAQGPKSMQAYIATAVGLCVPDPVPGSLLGAFVLLESKSAQTKLYLAGPLFSQAEWRWNARLVEALRRSGYDVFAPQEKAKAALGTAGALDARAIFAGNVKDIERAHVVVAVLDGPDVDSGTSWECGYAFKLGRPVVGIRTDFRSGGDDPKNAVNLMLSNGCREVILLPSAHRDDDEWIASKVIEAIRKVGP